MPMRDICNICTKLYPSQIGNRMHDTHSFASALYVIQVRVLPAAAARLQQLDILSRHSSLVEGEREGNEWVRKSW
jgi:hypothetical protein